MKNHNNADGLAELARNAIEAEGDVAGDDTVALAHAYLALREQVATLTADRDAWEVACHNATIEKHEQLAALRATPAEGVEWETLPRDLKAMMPKAEWDRKGAVGQCNFLIGFTDSRRSK